MIPPIRVKFVLTVMAAAASMTWVTPAHAQYSKMVMFGDSMSDNHRWYNFLRSLGQPGFPRPPNKTGRFSDGDVAAEVMANALGLPLQNYAYAGAASGYTNILLVPEGVLTEVDEHLADGGRSATRATVPVLGDYSSPQPGVGKVDPKALYVIWTGPDDYYSLGGMNATTAYSLTSNVQTAISKLYTAGARYFFVPSMPDLGLTPSARYGHEPKQPGYVATATKLSKQCRQVFTGGLQTMRERLPQAHIMSFDTMAFTEDQFTKLKAQGVNTTESCYNGGTTDRPDKLVVCPDPSKYVFWDGNHLTAMANKILGEAWAKAITDRP